jgi:glycosyltransferase involved in cell wall biosynthesis
VPSSISVVIPALDEEARIAAAIRSVRADAEVIVVDGGARAAAGDWIVFLHADTRLEAGWALALAGLPEGTIGGAFRLAIDSPRPAFRILEGAVRLRVRLFALPYGDQGIFVRGDAYARVGGVPPLPLMEDVAFVARLRRAGRLAFPPVRAVTSARRWDRHGLLGTTLRNWRTMALYAAGCAPESLARMYGGGEEGGRSSRAP